MRLLRRVLEIELVETLRGGLWLLRVCVSLLFHLFVLC